MNTEIFQKGISPIGGLCIAAVAGFVLLLILKLFPHYMDYNSIVSTHDNMAENDSEVLNYSLDRLQNLISLRLLNNQVRSYNRENTYLDDSGDFPVLGFSYEISEHIAFNAYALLKFSHKIEIKDEE
jgi:hypothetical protein